MKKNFLLLTAALVSLGAGRVWLLQSQNLEWLQCLDEMASRSQKPDGQPVAQFRSDDLSRLRQALSKRDTPFKLGYGWLFSRLPDSWTRYLPELLPSSIIRLNAAAVAGQWGPAAAPLATQLIPLLKDGLADSNAALSLARIGPPAKAAVPALKLAVQEQVPFAAMALAKIAPVVTAAAEPLVPNQ